MSMEELFITNDNGMKCLVFEAVMQKIEDARSYRDMLLFKTKCGMHFVGYKRGDEWWCKTGYPSNNEMELLPEDLEVIGWIGLE